MAAKKKSTKQPATIAPHKQKGVRQNSRKTKMSLSRSFRKQLIAHMYLTTPMTQNQIAEWLKDVHGVEISGVAVGKDLMELKDEWNKKALQTAADARSLEIQKLDALERSCLLLFSSGKFKDFVSTMLKVAKRRACLQGLDRPLKVALGEGDKDFDNMSDAELAKLARGIDEQLAAEPEEDDKENK
jgi:hypothetical protein